MDLQSRTGYAGISQVIPTIAGETYQVSFYGSNNNKYPNGVDVQWNGATLSQYRNFSTGRTSVLVKCFTKTVMAAAGSTSNIAVIGGAPDPAGAGIVLVSDISVFRCVPPPSSPPPPLQRSPTPPSPPAAALPLDYSTNCDLVLVNVAGSFVLEPTKLRFLLYLNISYAALVNGGPGADMPAFRADLRDAVAIAFKVPSSLDNALVPTSNVYIYDVSPTVWPSGGVPGSDYVAVTMSICASDTFASPTGWNLVNNPLDYWTANTCSATQLVCLPMSFFTNNACEC